MLATSLGLGTNVRNGVLAVDATEVSEDLTSTAGTLQQNSLATSGALEGKLVEGHNLTTSLLDASTSSLSDVEGSDVDLGDSQDTLIIGHSSDDHEDGISGLIFGVRRDLLERHGGSVVTGHHQAAEDDLVEVSLRTTSQELVQLDQEAQVGIRRDGINTAVHPLVLVSKINTLFSPNRSSPRSETRKKLIATLNSIFLSSMLLPALIHARFHRYYSSSLLCRGFLGFQVA